MVAKSDDEMVVMALDHVARYHAAMRLTEAQLPAVIKQSAYEVPSQRA